MIPDPESTEVHDLCADAQAILPALVEAVDGKEASAALLALASIVAGLYATLPGAWDDCSADVFADGFARIVRSEIDGIADGRRAVN